MLADLFLRLTSHFNVADYESRVHSTIGSGTLFAKISLFSIGEYAWRVFTSLTQNDYNAVRMATALCRFDSGSFRFINVSPKNVMAATLHDVCIRFQAQLIIRDDTQKAGNWRSGSSFCPRNPPAATATAAIVTSAPVATRVNTARPSTSTSNANPTSGNPSVGRPNGPTA
ncbi:hypothetical protein FBU31_003574 [Coemansia sp. 'formosensis']|nr:hypothetical protein FBU31_003574 [Coemansia sp. 'formosensis']